MLSPTRRSPESRYRLRRFLAVLSTTSALSAAASAEVRISRRLGVSGGDGNDRLAVSGGDYNSIDGGDGNDAITAGPKEQPVSYGSDHIVGGRGHDEIRSLDLGDSLLGGDGRDRLIGSTGNDELFGERGRDVLRGGAGDDRLNGGHPYQPPTDDPDDIGGGPGKDVVSYETTRAKTDVVVTLDGRANDGAPGERDRVRSDVENVSIERGTVVGDRQRNGILAMTGTLIGRAGDDTLNQVGPRGNRTLPAWRRSLIRGGKGDDRVDADERDFVAPDCEQVRRF